MNHSAGQEQQDIREIRDFCAKYSLTLRFTGSTSESVSSMQLTNSRLLATKRADLPIWFSNKLQETRAMQCRRAVFVTLLVVATFCIGVLCEVQPNIVFVLTDDQDVLVGGEVNFQ